MRSGVEIGASVPAFLGKLWKLVNDSETNNLISWSPGGKTFVIKNQADFARELLPLYYKHNNMASFIRQLNMYGFRKMTSVENGGLRYERDEIEFTHPCFMKGHAYLLEHIKRKIANPKAIVTSSESGEKILIKTEIMNKVLSDVKNMKGKQESLDAKFSAMKQENEALWREVAILRQKHIKQQQIVNNLIQFLMSLVQPSRASNNNASNGVGVKRPYQLMINSAAQVSNQDGPYGSLAKNLKMEKDVPVHEDLIEDNMEDGPIILELAHDDQFHGENLQDCNSPGAFATVESTSPTTATATTRQGPHSYLYHVTTEDDDEFETDAARTPLSARSNDQAQATPSPAPDAPELLDIMIDPNSIVSLSPGTSKPKTRSYTSRVPVGNGKQMTTSNSFNSINPTVDLRLPAEIFASDDSVSDAGITAAEDIKLESVLQEALQNENPVTKDKMFGGFHMKVEKQEPVKQTKKSKNKLRLDNIKTELQDDSDWNAKALATVNNNNEFTKMNSAHRRDFKKNLDDFTSLCATNGNNNDIDDHLDSMQTDLDSLRELLRSDGYSLDTNTLMGLFGADDPLYGLSFNPVDDRSKTPNNAEGTNQLISYTGNIPDFVDLNLPDLEGDSSQEACVPPEYVEGGSVLNTPQMVLRSPAYPGSRL